MNSQLNWNARLLQIAKEHPDATGEAGDRLRETLAQHATSQFTHDLQLSHARTREAVVTGARMALRSGAILLNAKATMPAKEFTALLRMTDISTMACNSYMLLALEHPGLGQQCLHRKGRITEADALKILKGSQDTVANLKILINNEELQP